MFSSLLAMSGFESINKRNSYKKESMSSSARAVSANTLKTINSFRTLPLIKSKSFNTSRCHRNDSKNSCSEPMSATNSSRRRLSWFERRTWSFRRGNKRIIKRMECWPDITIIFTKDAYEWDEYLTDCFTHMTDSQPLTIIHERLENINFPLGNYETQNLSNSRAVLLILSPDLLDFIDAHPEVFELTRLLNPNRTVVMLCGVQQQDISRFHRAALVSYDQWTCLEAKDQDKEFVLSVIQAVLLIIEQNESHISTKPQFKLTPRKVREGNGKVFILLDSPITDKQEINVLFDGSNEDQVTVKWKNPYNLYFTIPDNMLRVARVMNISLIVENKSFIGSRPLKCETKMSELHSLLTSVNSPFEFMCQTLGFATQTELDSELANRFEQKLPNFGPIFHNHMDLIGNEKTSDSYLPTLLHFASAYGLRELTTKLLHCPLALKACLTRNSNNLTPAQIAHHLNHTEIGALLDDFQRLSESNKLNVFYEPKPNGESELTDQERASLKRNVSSFRYSQSKPTSAHHQLYGLRLYSDLLHFKQSEQLLPKAKNNNKSQSIDSNASEYVEQELKNEFVLKDNTKCEALSDSSDTESDITLNVEHLSKLNELNELNELNDRNRVKKVNNTEASLLNSQKPEDIAFKIENSFDLNDIQKELLNIIDVFKKGMSFDDFEPLFENWRQNYCNVFDDNASKELNDSLVQIRTLCEIGRKQQKLENNKQSLKFNDLRYYLTSKLNNKYNGHNIKQTLHESLELLSLNQLFRLESLSPISISSTSSDGKSEVSNASLSDGTNHSTNAFNDNNKLNLQSYRNNYYKKPKTNAISLVERQNESQLKPKQSNSKSAVKSSKPPAPPPRPFSVSIRESKQFSDSDIKTNSNHNLYYVYQNNTKPEDKALELELDLDSKHNLTQFDDKGDKHLKRLSNQTKEISLKSNIKSKYQTKCYSLSDVVSHEYVNMSSSRTASPVMAKRDPLIDYDLVPSGIPIPINSSRAKALTAKNTLKKCIEEYDYDIPKTLPNIQNNSRLLALKCGNHSDEDIRDNERQVFV